jgi:hypothetical protein
LPIVVLIHSVVSLLQMRPSDEDEEFWGSLTRLPSEHGKTEDTTATPEVPEAVASTGSAEVEETAVTVPDSCGDQEEAEPAPVPREKILERINSKKEMKSYQLGKQLSFKWTTGAGPRIGCVRDYPSQLQLQALERVNLSPRCGGGGGGSRFASPQRRSFNSPGTARACEAPSTPREALRSPLQHGAFSSGGGS